MEISMHDLWCSLHGMGFGALFILGFSGAFIEFYGGWSSQPFAPLNERGQMVLRVYLLIMVLLAWLSVFSGAYIVYPWYRAVPPAGLMDLTNYPQRLLLSHPETSEWHNFGMEWKEHVAWIAPIAVTMVTYIYWKYGRSVHKHHQLRRVALIFMLAAFFASGVAGGFGAFLSKYAPIHGGTIVHLMHRK